MHIVKSTSEMIRYIHKDMRKISVRKLLKSTFLVTLAPFMVLTIFTLFGKFSVLDSLYAALTIFIISIVFITPYIRNLSALTNYVEQLAFDKQAEAPDLTFLNNVEELSEAVERLHWIWENRKNQLESMIAESKVLVDSLPDVLLMLDDNGNIMRTNKAGKNLFGDDHIQKLSFVLEDPEIEKIIDGVKEDGVGRTIEYSLKQYINRDFIISVEKVPLYSTTGIAMVVDMHDISELKRTEKMFADFVANASHEIRTPLTSLVGFIETLQGGAKEDPEALNNFLQIMSDQANRMTKLVKDLLSLSELERSLNNPPSEKVNLKEVLNNVKSQAKWMAKEKNISINFDFKAEPPIIIGDSSQLAQVFENLIGNSIKYGYDNSEVKVEVDVKNTDERIRKMLQDNFKKIITISVSDHSEGISPEHLPRLTERFYRVDKARSRKIGGTGLGLAIVKHILTRHHGGMDVESTLGKGSKFTVLLPIQ